MSQALILFAHGARDPEWAVPIRRVQAAVRDLAPHLAVECAFLEFMTPALPECADALAALGVARVVVLPMFIAQGGHLKRDVPLLIEALRQRHPGVQFVLAPAIGENDAVLRAMAATAAALAGS
ncbi:MAG: CbiX/SirB N-terminal domain-containing protein [Azonexus sp.]|nr:CbiX/SirB N-terminal domain-containing protein [Betaproteobacteria bacterium]MBK8917138.1 CbiX/SirB N-terminal domain-containing protein [Betaproteobacteria bacterium]MBP6035535.1 CbiX/SirB N-terminal domain-containing protein [Azonexus sp.]MBP6906231.1 CbiX/SirB N-terminal domain-containing protein [Azonexus sp.]